jgi:hypothetical protein
MKISCLALIGTVALLIAPTAEAAQYVYPSQGQDKAKQASDEAECSTWAKQQTGFDPTKAPAKSAAAPTGSAADTSAVTSALGALHGGGMGGIPGVGGGGIPGVGGLGGAAGMLGGQSGGSSQALGMVNQAMGKHPQQQQTQGLADYDKARAACLIGRGYSVQ